MSNRNSQMGKRVNIHPALRQSYRTLLSPLTSERLLLVPTIHVGKEWYSLTKNRMNFGRSSIRATDYFQIRQTPGSALNSLARIEQPYGHRAGSS